MKVTTFDIPANDTISAFDKMNIVEYLKNHITGVGGLNKTARTLKNVSPALLSNMINSKHDKISVEMWRNVAKQIGFKKKGLKVFKTSLYNELYDFLGYAQRNTRVHCIIGSSACGKTIAAEAYAKENKNAYIVECAAHHNCKSFLIEVMRAMGEKWEGLKTIELLDAIVRVLKGKDNPILILDEADKLKDNVLYYFITFYNKLYGDCAIILQATEFLKKRIEKGVKNNRKGFPEILTRIGSRFYELDGNTYDDIANICQLNGVKEENEIDNIINDCDASLRRVEILIGKYYDEKEKAA